MRNISLLEYLKEKGIDVSSIPQISVVKIKNNKIKESFYEENN